MVQFAEKVVNELFTVKTSKAVDAGALNLSSTKEKYEFIGRSIGNNSIQGYLSDKAKPYFDPNEANTISISQIGQQIATYHENEYYASQNMFVLKPIDFKLNRTTGLYFTTIFNCQLKQYLGSYTSYPTQNDVKQWKIKVPVTPSGELDTEYMASYVRKIEASYVRKIEAYLSVLGYKSMDDVKLTDHEQKLLDGGVKAQPTSKFKVGKFFNKKTVPGVSGYIANKQNKDGYFVYGQNIQPQFKNKMLLNDNYLFKIKYPILAFASSTGMIGLIEHSFYRTGDNGAFQALIPLKQEMHSIKILMFFLTSIKKHFEQFNYGTSVNNIPRLQFELPVTPSGDPDWQFMENYITAIEKRKVLKLKQFLDHKLDLYQKSYSLDVH